MEYRSIRKRFFALQLVLIGTLIIGCTMASCGDNELDGDWDPMKWLTDVDMDKKGNIKASCEGGTYVFNCKNYKTVWISDIYEITKDGKENVYYNNPEKDDYNNLETPWGKVNTDKSQVTIQLYENQSTEKRTYIVTVTVGDAFFHFRFDQSGK